MSDVIKIGPYHKIHLEPELYEVKVANGRITDVSIEQGFTHRGIEKLLESKTLKQGVLLAERVCGLCSQAHSQAYCTAVENTLGQEIPKRADYIRALAFELDRLHSHFMWFVLLFHTLKDTETFSRLLNEREKLMDLIEVLFGNRVHFSVNTLGGVKRDVSKNALDSAGQLLSHLKELIDFTSKRLEVHKQKLTGIGLLPKERARAYGVVGPVLRASGIASDIRIDDPYSVYGELEFEVPVEDSCDVWGRAAVRVRELYESLKLVKQIIARMPEGEIAAELVQPPVNEDCGRVEAPRGELIYYVRLNGTNFPERIKLRPPTYVNDPSVVEMLRDEPIEKLPLILESIDRCISCTNRITVVDETRGTVKRVALEELMK